METIKRGDSGAAVEDIQSRLVTLGYLEKDDANGIYDDATSRAVEAFCKTVDLPESADGVTDKVWAALVDASYNLGDRTLYLRMPYFHGHDVLQLQQALGAMGFSSGREDAIFGAHTELAVRKFQLNLGLPSDGIVGAYTYQALHHLQHSWSDKGSWSDPVNLGFARAADVLEANTVCLFGMDDFTRNVASRMSNLALATNPASKIVSADALSVTPDDDMLLVHVMVKGLAIPKAVPIVEFADDGTLASRIRVAIATVRARRPQRIGIMLPSETWEDAGVDRSAQHYAIALLDGLCAALS